MTPPVIDLTNSEDDNGFCSRAELETELLKAAVRGIFLHLAPKNTKTPAQRRHIVTSLRDLQETLNKERATGTALPSSNGQQSSGAKRKAFSVNPVCTICEEQYDRTNNPQGACRSHSGELEPNWDSEYWCDTDSQVHAIEYCPGADPDAWLWSCCGGEAKATPCRVGKHMEEHRVTTKRQKPWENLDDEEEEEGEEEEEEAKDDEDGY